MAQLFPPQWNWIGRSLFIGLPGLVVVLLLLALAFDRSDYVTEKNRYFEQPVPFSHKHHSSQLAIDCRYCHTQVERSAQAGLPASEVCLSCHSQIWKGAELLEPVHRSAKENKPLHWQAVTKLPDFVYFNHAIHIDKGVTCTTCHGEVGEMTLTRLRNAMSMKFCLDCHRAPQAHLRRHEEVFAPLSEKLSRRDQNDLGARLVDVYHVKKRTDCTSCHR